jgi:hypothetical protein
MSDKMKRAALKPPSPGVVCIAAGAGATDGVEFVAGEPTLLRRWRISGDAPGRDRELQPFAEALAPFASSSSRSPVVEFGPSNAPSARARRPWSRVSYEQSFFVPLTDAPVGFGRAPSLPPLTSASKKGGPKAAPLAGLGLSTVVDYERTRRNVSPDAIAAIRTALEAAGRRVH